jgi:hypothetical protein
MKKPTQSSARAPSEEEIREYAFHLYQQSGCRPGRDLDNWLEAKACLSLNIPRGSSHTRLHRHLHRSTGKGGEKGFTMPPSDALLCECLEVESVATDLDATRPSKTLKTAAR